MEKGNLRAGRLKKTVLDVLHNKEPRMLLGAGIGNDFSVWESEPGELLISADGFGESPAAAFHKAMNNFLCSLGKCEFARVMLFLPENVKESHIKKYMTEIEELAALFGVSIIGGNTRVSELLAKPSFSVTVFGKAKELRFLREKIHPEFDIVFAGHFGRLGVAELMEKNEEKLSKRFSAQYLSELSFAKEELSIQNPIKVIYEEALSEKANICYIHDISEGGIYTALWQLGEKIHKGIWVDNNKILVPQEIIEICECLNVNPYLLDGTGGVLLVCENGRRVSEAMKREGISAKVIGKVTAQKERQIYISENDIRTLSSEEKI